MRRLLLLIPLITLACGCDGAAPQLVRHGHCGTVDGVISLAWTIRGQPPTTASCQGIDHLSIEIAGDLCGATIAPVPCALDKWLYENLPEGNNTVTISALDRGGATVASGYIVVALTNMVPNSPAPLDLQ